MRNAEPAGDWHNPGAPGHVACAAHSLEELAHHDGISPREPGGKVGLNDLAQRLPLLAK